jgi:hypothetical protein
MDKKDVDAIIARLAAIEARLASLEARPVAYPYYQHIPQPHYPTIPWPGTIWCSDTTSTIGLES